MLRLDPNEELKIAEQDYLTSNSAYTSPRSIINIPISDQRLVRNNEDNNFNNFKLPNISSVSVNHQATEDKDLVTKAYVDSFYQENEQNRRDVGLDFFDESSDLVKNNQFNNFNNNIKLNVQSVEINDAPTSNNHSTNKKIVDNIITHESLLKNQDILIWKVLK